MLIHYGHLPGYQLLNVFEKWQFFLFAESNRLPVQACPASAPDTVHVALWNIR